MPTIHRFVFPIPPQAKQRPNKWGKSQPATRAFEEVISTMALEQWQRDPLEGRLAVSLMLYNERLLVTVEEFDTDKPNKLRGDLDNYAKSVLDAMQYIVFKNDSQIDNLHVARVREHS